MKSGLTAIAPSSRSERVTAVSSGVCGTLPIAAASLAAVDPVRHLPEVADLGQLAAHLPDAADRAHHPPVDVADLERAAGRLGDGRDEFLAGDGVAGKAEGLELAERVADRGEPISASM